MLYLSYLSCLFQPLRLFILCLFIHHPLLSCFFLFLALVFGGFALSLPPLFVWLADRSFASKPVLAGNDILTAPCHALRGIFQSIYTYGVYSCYNNILLMTIKSMLSFDFSFECYSMIFQVNIIYIYYIFIPFSKCTIPFYGMLEYDVIYIFLLYNPFLCICGMQISCLTLTF